MLQIECKPHEGVLLNHAHISAADIAFVGSSFGDVSKIGVDATHP